MGSVLSPLHKKTNLHKVKVAYGGTGARLPTYERPYKFVIVMQNEFSGQKRGPPRPNPRFAYLVSADTDLTYQQNSAPNWMASTEDHTSASSYLWVDVAWASLSGMF